MVEKMKYIKNDLILKNPLSFWANFPESERFFWFDPQKEEFVIGAERLRAVDPDKDNLSDIPYLFHSQTFLMMSKENDGKILGAKRLLSSIILLPTKKLLIISLVILQKILAKSLLLRLSTKSVKSLLTFQTGKNFFRPFRKILLTEKVRKL